MNTTTIKAEVEKSIEKLVGMRDEVRVRLHLASLDARQEWTTVAPHVLEAESAAKSLTEASRAKVQDAIAKVEAFLGKLH